MKKSRTTAFLLLTAILLSACGQGAGDSTETTSSDEISSGKGVTETSEPDIYADLPTGDYGGEKFTILNSIVTWAEYRIDSDEIDGDTMNDAVYERTRYVEDLLKVDIDVIEEKESWENVSYLANLVMAGDDSIDASFIGAMKNVANISKGLYVDLNEVAGLDFSKPWWDSNSMKYYEIDNKLYMAHNNTSANIHDTIWVGFFNKKIHEELGLEDSTR